MTVLEIGLNPLKRSWDPPAPKELPNSVLQGCREKAGSRLHLVM